MPLHPGGGHHLQCGADRGVGDQPGGVLRVGFRRHRHSKDNSHQPLPRPGHDAALGADVDVERRRPAASPSAAGFAQRRRAGLAAVHRVHVTVMAMLVLGGTLSLWGAVVGTLGYTVIDALLQHLQSGVDVDAYPVTLPAGSRR